MKRWTAGIVIAILAVVLMPACKASSYPQIMCSGEQRQSLLHLIAQAVPMATVFPCIERLAPGWSYGGSEVRSGYVHFWLDSDRVGTDAVDVTMTAACNVTGDTVTRVPTGDARLLLYEEPDAEHPNITVRHYVAEGVCATVRYSFVRRTAPTEFGEAQRLLGYQLRSDYVEAIRRETGLTLCGADAPPCPG
jgi:hypothetical protein